MSSTTIGSESTVLGPEPRHHLFWTKARIIIAAVLAAAMALVLALFLAGVFNGAPSTADGYLHQDGYSTVQKAEGITVPADARQYVDSMSIGTKDGTMEMVILFKPSGAAFAPIAAEMFRSEAPSLQVTTNGDVMRIYGPTSVWTDIMTGDENPFG